MTPIDGDELRRALCAIGVVGNYLGRDTIRRDSMLDLLDRRLAAPSALHCGPCESRCADCPIDWTRFRVASCPIGPIDEEHRT